MAVASASGKIAGVYSTAKATLTADPDWLIREHGRARRLWLAQTVSGAALPCLLLLFPVALYPSVDPVVTASLLCGVLAVGCGFMLARNGQLEWAALALVVGAATAITIAIMGTGYVGGGMDTAHIGLLDWYVVPSVLATMLLRRQLALAVTFICSVAMVLELLVLPRTPALQAYWQHRAAIFSECRPQSVSAPTGPQLAGDGGDTGRHDGHAPRVAPGCAGRAADGGQRAHRRARARTDDAARAPARKSRQIQSVAAAAQRGNLGVRVHSPAQSARGAEFQSAVGSHRASESAEHDAAHGAR